MSGSSSERSRVSWLTRAAFSAYCGSWRSRWPYSLTVTPQPEAFMTMASTAPRSTQGHQASMLARICARPPAWSLRWNLTAPQQPASRATTAWMPAASSTRTVAPWMPGIMEGCTQPSSSSTLRACSRVGRAPGASDAGTLARRRAGSRPRTAWPIFMAGPNRGEGRPSWSAQRRARSPAGRGTFSSTILRPMSTRWPYSTPLGQVVSQLRQVRQRSRCSCVLRVGCAPSSTCLMR